MRLIDPDSLKAEIESLDAESNNHIYKIAMEAMLRFFIELINEQPIIKVEPVRHGRWKDNGEDKFICSACKGYVYRWFGKSDFCPRCGARMDGGADE
jgi:rRNA maturation endonuclease Nob1